MDEPYGATNNNWLMDELCGVILNNLIDEL